MQIETRLTNTGVINAGAALRMLPGLAELAARKAPHGELDFMTYAGRQDAPWVTARPFQVEARPYADHNLQGISIARIERAGGLGWCEQSVPVYAYTILVDLDGSSPHEAMCDHRSFAGSARRAGEVVIYDRRHQWSFNHRQPQRCLVFHVQRKLFEHLAGNLNLRWSAEMPGLLKGGAADETMRQLALALWPIFDSLPSRNENFSGHLATSAVLHIAARYGTPARATQRTERLAPRREARIKELIRARLHERLTLADLAHAAGLSRSHFARAFAGSVGCSPHQWLLRQRVDHAKHLTSTTNLALSEIALACGFADQSHMTRVFSRMEKISPAAWKRSLGATAEIVRRAA